MIAHARDGQDCTTRERGTVISWNNAEGHGRIQSDAGDVHWSHFSFINMDGFKTLRQGQRVEFTRMTMSPHCERYPFTLLSRGPRIERRPRAPP